MDSAIWLSGIVVSIVIVAVVVGDRLSKLDRRIATIERMLRLHPEYRSAEKDLTEWQKLALDPSSKIQAIKAYREETGADLAEAKNAVEKWMKTR
jgi:ribosomal protein L7/L12